MGSSFTAVVSFPSVVNYYPLEHNKTITPQMLLAGSMTDAVTVVVIGMACRGGASSLKLERTEGSAYSANIAVM